MMKFTTFYRMLIKHINFNFTVILSIFWNNFFILNKIQRKPHRPNVWINELF